MKLSMKTGVYKVYILLQKKTGVTSVEVATCECAAGQVYKSIMKLVELWTHTFYLQ